MHISSLVDAVSMLVGEARTYAKGRLISFVIEGNPGFKPWDTAETRLPLWSSFFSRAVAASRAASGYL